MSQKALHRLALAIRGVYALCLAAGTYSHALPLLRHGLSWNYGGMPPASTIFLTSLTVVDPIIAAMLFIKPKLAIVLLLLLMVSDVAHNTWAILTHGFVVWMVADQYLFLAFLLATAPLVWKNLPPRKKRSSP